MLSEGARRRLLGELVEAGKALLGGLESGDPTAVDAAMAHAGACRADLSDDYACEMRRSFDELGARMGAAALPAATDVDRKALREALLAARGHVVGALASGHRSRTKFLGGGVEETVAGDPPRRSFEADVELLCERFGHALVTHLLRVLAGKDRIASLLDFLKMSSDPDDHTVRHERNFHFAALMTFAYLKEISNAIDCLGGSGIYRKLTDPAPWVALQGLAKHWHKKGDTLRNEVLFHLGTPKTTLAQVEKMAKGKERIVLLQWDVQPVERDVYRTPSAETFLMNACGLTLVELESVIDDANEAYSVLFLSLGRIVDDLLRQCGARLPPLQLRQRKLVKARRAGR